MGSGYVFEVFGERVRIGLEEKRKRVRLPNPDDEKWVSGGYPSNPWIHVLQWTGTWILSIEETVPGLPRKRWTESPDHPLEGSLSEILLAIIAAGLLLPVERRRRMEEDRQQAEAARLRDEEEERKRLDDKRWRGFTELAARWREVEDARQFLAALEQHPRVWQDA